MSAIQLSLIHFYPNTRYYRFIPVGSRLRWNSRMYSKPSWCLVYAPQLGARLHLTHTQLNVVGLAGNGV